MHVEHIIPLASGGETVIENLWLACPLCNGYKGIQTHAVDPETDERVPLYNPRTQNWREHFAWSADGTQIVGQTPVGKTTVVALRLNNWWLYLFISLKISSAASRPGPPVMPPPGCVPDPH